VSLLARIRSEQAQFQRLTEEQYFVLDMLSAHRQALVDGCAGSGKTMLAVEKARRLATEGFSTLLTCFNKNLAAAVRERLDPCPEQLRVQHFHELAHELVAAAGLEQPTTEGDVSEYFRVTLPTLLLDAVDRIDTRFDAIIVDEGQDFKSEWWIPLMSLLRRPDDIFYVFYDGQQSIYTDGPSLPLDSEPHYLPVNLRNTQAIHRTIAGHYTGRTISCRGPEGRPPTHLSVADPADALRKQLHRLVTAEGVSTEDIVILSAASQRRSRWIEGQKLGNLSLTWETPTRPDQVWVATIHSFKGLERPIVIVTDLEEQMSRPRVEQLRLVAYSRASSELITIEQA
jgi:superfamily I DNA/RNA helicase